MFITDIIEDSLDYIKEMVILLWACLFVGYIQYTMPKVRRSKVYRVRREIATIGGYMVLLMITCVSG